jgi:hypothetical protein
VISIPTIIPDNRELSVYVKVTALGIQSCLEVGNANTRIYSGGIQFLNLSLVASDLEVFHGYSESVQVNARILSAKRP